MTILCVVPTFKQRVSDTGILDQVILVDQDGVLISVSDDAVNHYQDYLIDDQIIKAQLLNALEEQKKQIWNKIKDYRYQRSLGGVFVKSIGKWFQTGEEEKTKYLGLTQVINQLGAISWKTYENDFVQMTPELLTEIFAEVVRAENADHINAERHKVALWQADNPLDYDYMTGWEQRYAD